VGKSCSGEESCLFSWEVPNDISHGNYTVEVAGENESAYYGSSDLIFYEYLRRNVKKEVILQKN